MSTKRTTTKKSNKKSTIARNMTRARSSRNLSRAKIKGKKCAPPNRFLASVTIIILGVAAVVLIALISIATALNINDSLNPSDASRFSSEYSTVSKDNVFVYASASDVIDVIEHGTGAIYLGFPSCPWCQAYAGFLNDVAKETGLNKIYYYNIQEARDNNTEDYQKLVSLLGPNLQYDESGSRRIYVPDAIFVVNGRIIGNDLESSKDTAGESTPESYWTETRINALKDRLKSYAKQVVDAGCTDSCN